MFIEKEKIEEGIKMTDKKLSKRIFAYIIDSTIVLLLTTLIINIKYLNPTYDIALEKSNTLEKLNISNIQMQNYLPLYYKDKEISESEYNDLIKDNDFAYLLVDAYSDSVITEDEYNYIITESKKNYDEKAPTAYQNALKANWYVYLVYIVIYLLYFVGFNMITKGITLGKKITKLQIVSSDNKEVKPYQYLIRSLISYGYFIYLLELIVPYIIPLQYIIGITSFLSLAMNTLQLVTGISVIINEEHCGIHDKLANTKVIETKDNILEARIKDLNLLSPEKKQELDDLVNNSKVEEKNEEEIKVAETENPTDGDSNTKPKTLKKEKSTTSKVKTKKTKEEK